MFLFRLTALEHDLFGKPVPTFPDHALSAAAIGGWEVEKRIDLALRAARRDVALGAKHVAV